MTRRHKVALDLDGVLATYEGWKGIYEIGPPIPGAVAFCNKLAEKYDVIINTSRCNLQNEGRPEGCTSELLKRLVCEWLDSNGFKYHDVYTGQGKVIASAYVDDRAVSCRPQDPLDPESRCAEDEFKAATYMIEYLCDYTSLKEKDTNFNNRDCENKSQ